MEAKLKKEWLSSKLAHGVYLNDLNLRQVVIQLKKAKGKHRDELETKKIDIIQKRTVLWQEFEKLDPPVAYYSQERIFPLSSMEIETVDKWPFILASFLFITLSIEQTKAWDYLYNMFIEDHEFDNLGNSFSNISKISWKLMASLRPSQTCILSLEIWFFLRGILFSNDFRFLLGISYFFIVPPATTTTKHNK